MTSRIAVTGVTGHLGGRVARLLSDAGHDTVLVGRDPERIPDLPHAQRRGPAAYNDRGALRRAFRDVDTLLLVSAHLSPRRLEEHRCAIDAAVEAGVRRVVYTSLLGASPEATYVNARDHAATEDALASSAVTATVLRPSFYATMLPRLADPESGPTSPVLRGPAADGRLSALSHDDLAQVATSVLLDTSGRYDGMALQVTGPEALTLHEAAEQLTRATGRRWTYAPESRGLAVSRLRRRGLSECEVENQVTWFEAIAAGEVDTVTDVVRDLTGHPALRVEDCLRGSGQS